MVARERDAQAEIRILGDVPRVPAVEPAEDVGAEMRRGASERRRHAPRGERRAEHVEQRRVLDREQARQKAVPVVVDDEMALQAGDGGSGAGEAGRRDPELVGLDHVLRVVDHEEFAAGEGQGGAERPWLGARQALGNGDDFEAGRQRQLRSVSKIRFITL